MTPAPLACPACRRPLRRLTLGRKPLGVLDIDCCDGCQAFWFDAFESPQLTPGAIIELLRAIQASARIERTTLPAARLFCPRCDIRLKETHDLQRATRFSYWRCERGHGRFTPFMQFLREKDFIRPLSDQALARLRDHVRTIRCSGCGAPVDIERSTACSYCRSPIAALDPEAIARALDTLDRAQRPGPPPPIERVVDDALASTFARANAATTFGASTIVDLIDLGVGAIVDWLDD